MVDLCIHIANVLYLLSFLARDMLWLRLLTCLGLVLGIVFFTCQPAPMYGPTVWHVVFLGINIVQIRRLILERRRLMLPPPVQQAAEAACKDLTHDQLLTVLTRAMWNHPDTLQDVRNAVGRPLTHEEEVVRDLALCRLSRNEMLNLLTRRLFATFRWAWGRPPATTPRFHAPPQSPLPEPGKGGLAALDSDGARGVAYSPLPGSGRGTGGQGLMGSLLALEDRR